MRNGFVPFAEVKRAVSIEAILSRYDLLGSLTEKGGNLVGACPFCNGKSARQFQVSPTKNAWYCFGCKQGGNVLDFVARREGKSVRAAAGLLDRWFELGLAETSPEAKEQAPPPLESAPATEHASPQENPPLTFALKTLDPHHESLAALGLEAVTLKRFGGGYCSKGLLKGRLAIPIHDVKGNLLAYGGLALGGEAPRYLFPPKFHAALEVFNLHRLPEAALDAPLYLTSEIDGVLRLTEAGECSALGLFDGSLSSAQEEAIARALTRCERLVLVGDGFPDRTVARLARLASITWLPSLTPGVPVAELGEPSPKEEGL